MGQQQPKGLTKRQEAILNLIEREGCTQAQISRRLSISPAAVSKHVTKLRKGGFLGGVNRKRLTTGVPPGVYQENGLRLHGEQYRVGIVRGSELYRRTRLRSDSVQVWGNRVVLYRDVLMVFSYESFYGASVEECDAKAAEYWFRFLQRLETLYGVLLLKERKENVRRVKAHYGELGNELADDLRRRKEKTRVFGTLDGKEWLLFDDSSPDGVGLAEAETTHSPTARDGRDAGEDMRGVVQPFFNDLRDNRPALLSVLDEGVRRHSVQLDDVAQMVAGQSESLLVTQKLMEALATSLKVVTDVMAAQHGGVEPEDLPPDMDRPDYFG